MKKSAASLHGWQLRWELLELADEATDRPSAYDYYRPVRVELIEADRTYRRLALQYHPDRKPSGQETIKRFEPGRFR
jgi:hypothetical protein